MRSTAIRQRNVFIVLLCIGIASRAPAKSPIDDNPILTEAECHDFAERLTRAVEKGNVRDCSELFNESGIVDRFFEGIDFGPNNREQTIRAVEARVSGESCAVPTADHELRYWRHFSTRIGDADLCSRPARNARSKSAGRSQGTK